LIAVCGTVAVAGIWGCSILCAGTLLGYPLCVALCVAGVLVIEAGCIAAALLIQKADLLDCDAAYLACTAAQTPVTVPD